MPQEFQVLQCFRCKIFQVQIIKRKPKWECKMCYEKQSIIKIFMKSGYGKDCRIYVQELNRNRIQNCEKELPVHLEEPPTSQSDIQGTLNISLKNSKWNDFVEKDIIENEDLLDIWLEPEYNGAVMDKNTKKRPNKKVHSNTHTNQSLNDSRINEGSTINNKNAIHFPSTSQFKGREAIKISQTNNKWSKFLEEDVIEDSNFLDFEFDYDRKKVSTEHKKNDCEKEILAIKNDSPKLVEKSFDDDVLGGLCHRNNRLCSDKTAISNKSQNFSKDNRNFGIEENGKGVLEEEKNDKYINIFQSSEADLDRFLDI